MCQPFYKESFHLESFTIPFTISNTKFEQVMLVLGSSINAMYYSIYASLNLSELTGKSNAYPKGVLEDVLELVNELVFPTDFYVLDMEDDSSHMPTPLLLGRSFIKTAKADIDVYNGTLTMEFDRDAIHFKGFKF